jgi:uncharacterized C2H2 Zn-finger protein
MPAGLFFRRGALARSLRSLASHFRKAEKKNFGAQKKIKKNIKKKGAI